jgi:hypothetical protein
MALTLTEGEKYSTTELDKTVIDLLVKDSPELALLPFENLMGNSLTYDVITTDSEANFYAVNDTWLEGTPSLTQYTANLKILGGDADMDNFLLRTRSNKIDMKAQILANKVKAVQYKFLDTFYYGDDSSDANEFDGLQVLIANTTYNTVHAGTDTGTALSMAKLYEAFDLAVGNPTHIFMSKAMRRGIQVYMDSIGDKFPIERDEYGKLCEWFQGAKIVPTDHIVNTETAASGAYTAKTGGANTSIFIVQFGSQECCGLQGGSGVETIEIGDLETKDASRYRIRWYCGLKFEKIRSCAKVDGIIAAGTVTA